MLQSDIEQQVKFLGFYREEEKQEEARPELLMERHSAHLKLLLEYSKEEPAGSLYGERSPSLHNSSGMANMNQLNSVDSYQSNADLAELEGRGPRPRSKKRRIHSLFGQAGLRSGSINLKGSHQDRG